MKNVSPAPLHVMAGVLLRGDGCVLLAQRPAGKHLAGFWEFPGGKLEQGEQPRAGLARELREELGVIVLQCAPLLVLPWQYDDRVLLLDTWRVNAWEGTPRSLEGQALQWRAPAQVDSSLLAPADRAILEVLQRVSTSP